MRRGRTPSACRAISSRCWPRTAWRSHDVERYAVAAGPGLVHRPAGRHRHRSRAWRWSPTDWSTRSARSSCWPTTRPCRRRRSPARRSCAWMEAYRGEVFAARYRVRAGGAAGRWRDPAGERVRGGATLDVLDPPTVSLPEPLARAWAADGAGPRHRDRRRRRPQRRPARRELRRGRAAARAGAARRHARRARRRAHADAATRPHAVVPHLRAASRRRARPRSRRGPPDGVSRARRAHVRGAAARPRPRRARTRPGRHPRGGRGHLRPARGRARCTNGSGRTRTWPASTWPGRAGAGRRLLRRLGDLRRAAHQQPRRRSRLAAARASRGALLHLRPGGGGGRRRRARDAGGAAVERAGPPPLRAVRLRLRRASGTAYYREPVEDALVLWRGGLGPSGVVKPGIRMGNRPVESPGGGWYSAAKYDRVSESGLVPMDQRPLRGPRTEEVGHGRVAR